MPFGLNTLDEGKANQRLTEIRNRLNLGHATLADVTWLLGYVDDIRGECDMAKRIAQSALSRVAAGVAARSSGDGEPPA